MFHELNNLYIFFIYNQAFLQRNSQFSTQIVKTINRSLEVFVFVCGSNNLPKAVRNKKSSPSRQNTSQTRQATSRGKDLLNNVNILKQSQENNNYYLCIYYFTNIIANSLIFAGFSSLA